MSLKISTSYMFDRATERMSNAQGRLSHTQAQLAESKQVLSPSDAPDQAAAIDRLRQEIDRQKGHAATLQTAFQRYTAEETALGSAVQVLTRIRELATQAGNDSLAGPDREAIAVELKGLRNQLVTVGNTRDDSGNYLFSGTRVTTPAFAVDIDGNVVYQGDQTQTRVPAGVERTVLYTRSGTDIYSRVVRTDDQGQKSSVGFFDALDDLISAAEGNDGPAIRNSLGEAEQMLNNLSLAQAQCGSDQQVVESQSDVIAQTTLRLKSTLSSIEDLDYTEAVARMNKEMTALQAAMSSFGRLAGLSLFDHLN
jgi:flagellar hook-associated protein 3 FlgL